MAGKDGLHFWSLKTAKCDGRLTIAEINEEISGLDTIYVRAGILGSISSSTVRELYKNGKDVSKYVPEEIRKIM